MNLREVKQCPLFIGIEDHELESLFVCLGATRRSYGKEEYVFRAEEPAVCVGILLSGGAHVIQEDFWGNRFILTHLGPGNLFGEAFSCGGAERLPVSVVAVEFSEVLLLDYRKIIDTCPTACAYHARLISNMMRILAEKNILLTQKMEHLSKRTTREKVLSFLSSRAVQTKSRDVSIPFNRQELADYLCVERSALSRELSAMKKEGVIGYNKNMFTLYG